MASVKMSTQLPPAVESELEALRLSLTQCKKKLTELRKKGKDVMIIHLKLLPLESKLKVYEIMQDQKTLDYIKSKLLEIKNDLDTVEKEIPQL